MQNFKDWTVAKGRPLLDNGEGKLYFTTAQTEPMHHHNVPHNWEWLPTYGLTPLAPTQSMAGSFPNHASHTHIMAGSFPNHASPT
jgi:hypothetical protein